MPHFIVVIDKHANHVIFIMTPQLCNLLRSIQKACDALKPKDYNLLLASPDTLAIVVANRYNNNMRNRQKYEGQIMRVMPGFPGIDLALC